MTSHYIVPFKTPLYRYTKRKYADSFFVCGQLRLGTLYDYWRVEHNSAIGDITEGYYTPKPKIVDGILHAYTVFCLNQWAFCVSKIYSKEMMESFEADCCFSIRSIDFFYALTQAIPYALTVWSVAPVIYVDKGMNNESVATDPVKRRRTFPGNFKNETYRSQQEVRVLWEPIGGPPFGSSVEHGDESIAKIEEYRRQENARVQPIFVNASDAVQYCRVL